MSRRYFLSGSVLASPHLLDLLAVHHISASDSSRFCPLTYQVSSPVMLSLELTTRPVLVFLWCAQPTLIPDSLVRVCSQVSLHRRILQADSDDMVVTWFSESFTSVITACGCAGWGPCLFFYAPLTVGFLPPPCSNLPLVVAYYWALHVHWLNSGHQPEPSSLPAFLPFSTVSNAVCWKLWTFFSLMWNIKQALPGSYLSPLTTRKHAERRTDATAEGGLPGRGKSICILLDVLWTYIYVPQNQQQSSV